MPLSISTNNNIHSWTKSIRRNTWGSNLRFAQGGFNISASTSKQIIHLLNCPGGWSRAVGNDCHRLPRSVRRHWELSTTVVLKLIEAQTPSAYPAEANYMCPFPCIFFFFCEWAFEHVVFNVYKSSSTSLMLPPFPNPHLFYIQLVFHTQDNNIIWVSLWTICICPKNAYTNYYADVLEGFCVVKDKTHSRHSKAIFFFSPWSTKGDVRQP